MRIRDISATARKKRHFGGVPQAFSCPAYLYMPRALSNGGWESNITLSTDGCYVGPGSFHLTRDRSKSPRRSEELLGLEG
jgi:hypothetical protein